jgi:predicted MFS family arabinose efflux permease
MAFLFLFPDSLRWLFAIAIIPGIIVTAIVFVGLKEQPRRVPAGEPFRLEVTALGSQYWWFLAAVGVFSLGCASDLFLLARLSELGVATYYLPLIWCAFHVLKSYGNVWIGRWTDRIPPTTLLFAGWIYYVVVYLLMGWIDSAGWAIGLFLLYAGFYALTEPPEKTLVAQLVPVEQRGQGFGWFHFVTGIAVLPASVLFGWLYDRHGAAWAFQCSAGIAFAAAVVLALSLLRSSKSRPSRALDRRPAT